MMAPANPRTSPSRPGSTEDTNTGTDRVGVGRAHGKVILLGEHAAVYGAPALAMPVPRMTVTASVTASRCADGPADQVAFMMRGHGSASEATPLATDGLCRLVAEFRVRTGVDPGRLDVLVDSEIPQGRGLGSSAACARAAVLALADLFDRPLGDRDVFELVQASEQVVHGKASGIDALTTGATAPVLFRSGSGGGLAFPTPADAAAVEPADGRTAPRRPYGFDGLFVIADSGVGGSTREAVRLVGEHFERSPEAREEFLRRVTSLTCAAAEDLVRGRPGDFGARMTENHGLLRGLGLSTERIEDLVHAALSAGGLGAKISGGGLGGCVVALAAEPAGERAVVRHLHEAGAARTWVVPVGRFADHAA
ncbi:mevalonate kinase [Streptomyces tsukubensis]